ncbi:cell envelope integrity protein TolA [Polynucleobacter paneuropaeus]|nr:cell envelope integrity protein TolA [Polynucleobacter paneuropaeus]
MKQVANEVTSFKSEVLSNGGSIQRAQNREELKERERLRKEAEDKHAAEVHARRVKAREERDLKLAERAAAQKASDEEKAKKAQEQAVAKLAKEQEAEKQKALRVQKEEPKSQATSLLDDLSKASKPSASLAQISEDIEEGEELEDSEVEPIFAPVKGEVQVPAMMTAPEGELEPQAYDLGELLPAPAAITVDVLPQPAIQTESAEEFINRVLNPGPADSSPENNNKPNEEASGDIKSKRGCERIQKIINEKRDLEKQVEDLQVIVVSLQDAIRKYEIESQFVDNTMALTTKQKKPAELVSEAKHQIIKYLNSREDEVDHSAKAQCFYKYLTDPFYMQVFVQTNKPEQWQSTIESIYDSIGTPEPSFANAKITPLQTLQPIRARTSTLGAPLASSENPMDRIAQHLGNMGI